jgi:hypothetical protein
MRADRHAKRLKRLLGDASADAGIGHWQPILGDPEGVGLCCAGRASRKQGRAIDLQMAIEQQRDVLGQNHVDRLRVLGLAVIDVQAPATVFLAG